MVESAKPVVAVSIEIQKEGGFALLVLGFVEFRAESIILSRVVSVDKELFAEVDEFVLLVPENRVEVDEVWIRIAEDIESVIGVEEDGAGTHERLEIAFCIRRQQGLSVGRSLVLDPAHLRNDLVGFDFWVFASDWSFISQFYRPGTVKYSQNVSEVKSVNPSTLLRSAVQEENKQYNRVTLTVIRIPQVEHK